MQVHQLLMQATRQLAEVGILTARLDVQVLLEDITGHDRGYLLAHPEYDLTDNQQAKLANLLKLRAQHVPLAYMRGTSEFYGRSFKVGPGVLIPRPESETMIDILKELISGLVASHTPPPTGSHWRLADVGAGSGALGVTAALELANTRVELLEIDDDALRVAKTNVINFATTMPVIKSDLLASCKHNYDILLCNLPYIPDDFAINSAAKHEPPVAIFGGVDGLDVYRQLFKQIVGLPDRPLYILTESLPESHDSLANLASNNGYELQQTDGFIQQYKLT